MCWCECAFCCCFPGRNDDDENQVLLLDKHDKLTNMLANKGKGNLLQHQKQKDKIVELKINEQPLTVKDYQLKVINQYPDSIKIVSKSKPSNIIHNWCFDTAKIIYYTLRLLICCPCNFSRSVQKLAEFHQCQWCVNPNINPQYATVCCRFYCCKIKCGPDEIRDDAEGLVIIFMISLAPFISCFFWLLSIANVIEDYISAAEVFLPLITLLIFGKTALYSTLSKKILKYVIEVDYVSMDDFDVTSYFKNCKLTYLKGKNKAIPLYKLHRQGTDEGCMFCIVFLLSLLYGLIHIIEMAVNKQYDECHTYCIYVIIVTLFINASMMGHIVYLIGFKFFTQLRKYKWIMEELHYQIIINKSFNESIALYEEQNHTKWFNLWCVSQNKAFESFKQYEYTLFACFVVLLASGIVIGYSIIFRLHEYDNIVSNTLLVSLGFIWIMFLIFIVIIMKYGYSFTSIQNKQISALRAQQTLISNVISEIHQDTNGVNTASDEILYLGQVSNSINSIIEQISHRSLSPSILGVKIDKVFVILVVSNVISFIPAILRYL